MNPVKEAVPGGQTEAGAFAVLRAGSESPDAVVPSVTPGGDASPTQPSAPVNPRLAFSTPPTTAAWSRIAERLDHSELRLGLHTEDFGQISIDAVLRRDSLGATLRVEHPALRTALAGNLAELKSALEGHRLELGSFSVMSEGGGARSQKDFSGHSAPYRSANPDEAPATTVSQQNPALPVTTHDGRLNIHA